MVNYHRSLDRVFRGFAHPTRREMLERLSEGPLSVGELAGPLDMSLAAVVQHVQVLERSGVIRTEKIGRVRKCHLEPGALREAETWISSHRAQWERRLDRLGQVLASENAERSDPETNR